MTKCSRSLPFVLSALLLLSACGGQAPAGSAFSDEEDNHQAQAAALLSTIPYYGDSTQCTMTAQQATEFAKVIRAGIAGQLAFVSGYSEVLTTPYWEQGFTVGGYGGNYESDRARVILGDFAGDGNPYLYVCSSQVDSDSFDIYGWTDGMAFHVAGEESWGGRQSSALYETERGTVEMVTGGSSGAASHSSATLAFRGGRAEEIHTYSEEWDYGRSGMLVNEDGTETFYTEAEWYAYLESDLPEEEAAPRELPYAPLEDVLAGACTLREMAAFLNDYAALLSDGTAERIELPEVPEDSDAQKAARAMLNVLDNTYGVSYARLVDLDEDGDDEKELLISCEYDCTAYRWQDGALVETVLHQGPGMTDALTLIRNPRGTYGICANGNTDGSFYTYIFLSGVTDSFQIFWDEYEENEFSERYFVNDETVTEEEFRVMINCYATVEPIYSYGEEDSHIEETRMELQSML